MRVRSLCLFLLLLVAACQTEAHRLLVVDLTLADPLTLETTAAPWHAAGYRVEYRRFYPHLTREDLTRYRTVLVLGGRQPESLSDALTIGDLAILTEWIRRDGVVVLAYTDDGGALDRWIMNRWLASQGAGIAIAGGPGGTGTGGAQLLDATPLPHSALDNAGFAPFPAGRNYPLQIRDKSQTLARGGGTALVAASRVQDRLIVVASRSLLASADADSRARDFLVALARWTRRPREWAGVGAGRRPAPRRPAATPPSRWRRPRLRVPTKWIGMGGSHRSRAGSTRCTGAARCGPPTASWPGWAAHVPKSSPAWRWISTVRWRITAAAASVTRTTAWD